MAEDFCTKKMFFSHHVRDLSLYKLRNNNIKYNLFDITIN